MHLTFTSRRSLFHRFPIPEQGTHVTDKHV